MPRRAGPAQHTKTPSTRCAIGTVPTGRVFIGIGDDVRNLGLDNRDRDFRHRDMGGRSRMIGYFALILAAGLLIGFAVAWFVRGVIAEVHRDDERIAREVRQQRDVAKG